MSYKNILRDLIAAEGGDLSDDRLAELAATAQTLASLGPNAPPVVQSAPKPDRKQVARAKYDALMATPISPHASAAQKSQRAAARAQLLAVMHDMEGVTDHNGYFRRTGGGGPEAA
jgi:hypothetical protein